jgi:hypothetical protein
VDSRCLDPPSIAPDRRVCGCLDSCASYGGFSASQFAFALANPTQNCAVNPSLAARSNGFFGDVPPITYASITDGLSQTLIMADKSVTALQMIDDPLDPFLFELHGWWIVGRVGQTLLAGAFPPRAVPCCVRLEERGIRRSVP